MRPPLGSRRKIALAVSLLSRPCGEGKRPAMQSAQRLVSFEEVAVHFSKGEWSLLSPAQRALYKEVMLENFGTVASLGPEIAKPDLISRLEGEEEPFLPIADAEEGLAGGLWGTANESSESPVMDKGDTYSEVKVKAEYCDTPSEEERKHPSKGRHHSGLLQGENGHEIPLHGKMYIEGKRNEGAASRGKFSKESEVNTHWKTWKRKKKYECLECGRFFRQNGHLTTHQRVHTEVKSYKCLECGRSFSQIGNFTRHQIVHTGEKPYQCPVCEKSFSLRGSLKRHKRTHTEKKPYKSLECGKSFNQSGHLTCHQRINTEEKPNNNNNSTQFMYHPSGPLNAHSERCIIVIPSPSVIIMPPITITL
ncbi:zinc finger protein 135-like [Eublepharis macularius]|uniref:Zinc finger protein 135-like n=1 Tax=Eublepharis macularius TaxID=481883 RepID=A0AA97J7A6_EUBMA|nr:zinc finger protein 135-like [Eublepharis macularius]